MFRLLLSAVTLLLTLFCSSLSAYNPCADINDDNKVNLFDVVQMINEHQSCWGWAPPLPAGKGDIDYRAGYNQGDLHHLLAYLFRNRPEGGCPWFPPYSPVQSDDTVYVPSAVFGSESGAAKLPILFKHQGWVSDLLVPLTISGLSVNVVIDSLQLGGRLQQNSQLGAALYHWPQAFILWSRVMANFNLLLQPGVDTLGYLWVHWTSAAGDSLVVDTPPLGPHTFLNYTTSELPTNDYDSVSVAVPKTAIRHFYPGGRAVMLPDPQYVYYLHALTPMTDTVYFGYFPDGRTASQVDPSTVQIGTIIPTSVSVLPASHGFEGDIIAATLPLAELIAPLGAVYDTTLLEFTVSWEYLDDTPASIVGSATVIGKNSQSPSEYLVPPDFVVVPGDINLDGSTDISDAVAMIGIIFGAGPIPDNANIGDVDCSHGLDISDAVYLVLFIFANGPAPCVMP